VLKVAGLVIDGDTYSTISRRRPRGHGRRRPELSRKQDRPADVTGSTPKPKRGSRQAGRPAPEVAKPDGVVVYPEQTQPVSASERAILERLQSRRQELEARAREIDIRENLLKAAEKRIESRVEEMKAVESRITTATGQKAKPMPRAFKASSPCMRA